MKRFYVEHIGISVESPGEMAGWYRDALGFDIMLSAGDEENEVAFIGDGGVMLELGRLRDIPSLSSRINHPLQFHIALRSDDPHRDARYLESKGATFIEECDIRLPGDLLVILKDPWGNTIQLSKRSAGTGRAATPHPSCQ